MRSRSKDTRRETRKGVFLVVATGSVALSLLASACGSGSSPKPGSSGSAYTQAVKFAQCMRANGETNWPDPSQQRTPAITQPDRSELPHVPDGVHDLSKRRAERPARASRADSRPAARRAHLRPMHAHTRAPRVPGPARDVRARPDDGQGGVLPPQQHHRFPVALVDVQAGSKGLRSTGSSGSP